MAIRVVIAALLSAIGIPARAAPALSPEAQLGRRVFFDPALSASGRQSCATCHDPANHYAPGNAMAVQPGGAHMDRLGFRATPSLTYIDKIPAFSTHLLNPDDASTAPGGGQDWDGRSATIAEQGLRVLTTTYEMANQSEDALVHRIQADAALAHAYRAVFGDAIFATPHGAFAATGRAIEAFILQDPSFHPYSSKYDAYTRGLASLTPAETRGMAIFNDAERANCAQCHTAGIAPARGGGTTSNQFSDFFMRALDAPRNPAIDDAAIGGHDDGVCGPLRSDLTPTRSAPNARLCGLFMTPTLRNTASRHVYFHNGALTSLRDVVEFYISRDITPARWYGEDRRNDDLQGAYRRNIDTQDMPFRGQHPGGRPVITEAQVDDLVAFLGTLTDGYTSPTH